MKRLLTLAFLNILAASALMGAAASQAAATKPEAVVSWGGVLALSPSSRELSPQLFAEGWKWQRATGGMEAVGEGVFPFRFVKDGQAIHGTAVFKLTADGAVDAAYTFTPARDTTLNSLYVGLNLPSGKWAGGEWKIDGERGELPLSPGKNDTVAGGRDVRGLTLVSADGAERLVFSFPKGAGVLVQDDRRRKLSHFVIRIGQTAPRVFKAGAPFSVRFTLATSAPLQLVRDTPLGIKAGPEWIPLRAEADILAGSALDFSAPVLAGAPAGKHGRVVARGPHFEFEQQPGVSRRFYGANLCFSANFPPPEQAARLAARLARTGYNTVRLHHHDGGLVEGSPDGTTPDPGQFALMDALVDACVRHGIYISTDLYVSRAVPWRVVGIDRDGKIPMSTYKLLAPVHEGVFQNLLEFSRHFLGHVNPATGRRYADEPALAWLALINEGNPLNYVGELRAIPEWGAAWKTWLAGRRARDAEAFAGIPETLPDNPRAANRHTAAFALFLAETEARMVARLKKFLRDEMKCRALVSNLSGWETGFAPDQTVRDALFDYVDDHFYVDHPEFLERRWQLPTSSPNENLLRREAMGVHRTVFTRLLNKPFTISEWNYASTGSAFRSAGGMITGALGALQDWAGVWRFDYSRNRDDTDRDDGIPMRFFDLAGDPLMLASERAALCLFLRGDLPALANTHALVLPVAETLEMRDKIPLNRAPWPWVAWHARLGTIVANKAPADAVWSGRYPEVYDAPAPAGLPPAGGGAVAVDRERGSFAVSTPRTCGGFAESGVVDAGDLVFDTGGLPATVWVSALDDRPIRDSSRLLLTHLTDMQDTGARYAGRARKILLAHGTLPHLARNGRAGIRLALGPGGAPTVHALSTGGRRVAEISSRLEDGWLVFTADIAAQPDSATLLYEITRAQ